MDSLTIYRIKDYPARIYALFQLDEVAIKLNKGGHFDNYGYYFCFLLCW